MAALVQAYPQPTGTTVLLQTQPKTASVMLPTQASQAQQYAHPVAQQRNGYHDLQSTGGRPVGYRGTTIPVQPYAFTSAPSLNHEGQWQQVRSSRTSSMPAVPTIQHTDPGQGAGRPRYIPSASMTNLHSTSPAMVPSGVSRDDLSVPVGVTRRVAPTPRPQSAYYPTATPSQTILPPQIQAAPARSSPERYRRPASRTLDLPASTPHVHTAEQHRTDAGRNQQSTLLARPNSLVAAAAPTDDMYLYRGSLHDESAKLRRRSLPALDFAGLPNLTLTLTPPGDQAARVGEAPRRGDSTSLASTGRELQKPARLAVSSMDKSRVAHSRTGSSESAVSSRSSGSRPSSAHRNTHLPAPTANPALLSPKVFDHSQDNKTPSVPLRSPSSDAAPTKRASTPSPLSKPAIMNSELNDAAAAPAGNGQKSSATASVPTENKVESPAIQHLSAINGKGGKLKSKTSRLRRAFSFGSAAEFRKVAGQDAEHADITHDATAAKLHKDPSAEELYDAEQARIAKKQEAGGLGNSIYGGRFFSGSTDNLSISSTASSASVMIRKMGRGVKKGGRSLVGIFRPKSALSDPIAETQVQETSQASVSMVTVEAERQRVNVTADLHTQSGGGTGFPRLDRNSVDAARTSSTSLKCRSSSETDTSGARKSILGGDKERSEVLAAVRKGILKHTNGSSSPKSETKTSGFDLPNIPQFSDSPSSSAPSTPNDDAQGRRRAGSVAIGGEDYFVSALRLRQDTKSAPGTPQGASKRNATFSPRIVFYDTWPSGEYDRRGEIATCNRLTPVLAQQIKEELNNFKMEMEVHENSKIYTQFF